MKVPFEQGDIKVPQYCVVELSVYVNSNGDVTRIRHIAAGSTAKENEILKRVIAEARTNLKYEKVLGEYEERRS